MSDLLAIMTSRGFSPRKVSLNHGGEFVSSCPACGDGGKGGKSDRFHIWPTKDSGGRHPGRYWCRQCGISGDTIAFLQKIGGLSFPEACNQLGIALQGRQSSGGRRYQPPPSLPRQQEWQPTIYPEPGELWQEKAQAFLEDCHQRLLNSPTALRWLAERGITEEAAREYTLGYNSSSKDGDRYRPRRSWGLPEKMQNGKARMLWIPRGWVIPSFNRQGPCVHLRIRRLDADVAAFCENIRYLPVDGSSMATMVLHPEAEIFVVVESGFDAVLLAWTMCGKIGAITTWNSSARPDARTHALLTNASLILGGLDYDQGGDREQAWWQATYPQYRRLQALPGGAKDPGDAAKAGADLAGWMVSGIPRGLRIKLGFIPRTAVADRTDSNRQPGAQKQASPQAAAEVSEMTLTNGKVIYLTDDRDQWTKLSNQGLPVFSSNEMTRLRTATAAMSGEERLAAALQVVELKEIFGGYIRAGRAEADGEQGQ
jgi:DNA primase